MCKNICMIVSWTADVRPPWRVEVRHDPGAPGRQDPSLAARVERALRDSDLARSPRVRLASGALVVELSVKAEDEPDARAAAAVLVRAAVRGTASTRATGWCTPGGAR